jgi:hypothetical protein
MHGRRTVAAGPVMARMKERAAVIATLNGVDAFEGFSGMIERIHPVEPVVEMLLPMNDGAVGLGAGNERQKAERHEEKRKAAKHHGRSIVARARQRR